VPHCHRVSSAALVRGLALALLGLGVAACSQSRAPRPTAELAGTITYRERIALPATARVEIQLLDVTDPDEPSPPLVAERLLDAPGQVPIAFSLGYDPDAVDANRTYSLRVRVRVGEDLWFASPFDLRVLTGGNPDRVEVLLDRVSDVDVSSGIARTAPDPDPPNLDPRVKALREEARSIDARLDRYDMREIPIEGARLLQLWFDGERPIKLVVSDTGRLTRTTSYYFRDGRLFWVRGPSAGWAFENESPVLRTDAKLAPLADTSGGSGVLGEARSHLAEFGL
jgi:putative lipoprotein